MALSLSLPRNVGPDYVYLIATAVSAECVSQVHFRLSLITDFDLIALETPKHRLEASRC